VTSQQKIDGYGHKCCVVVGGVVMVVTGSIDIRSVVVVVVVAVEVCVVTPSRCTEPHGMSTGVVEERMLVVKSISKGYAEEEQIAFSFSVSESLT
jgi:hypothetical protein